MVRKNRNGRRMLDCLMLNGGTTSYLTPLPDQVHSKTPFDTTIYLAEDSTIVASSKGVRSVQFCTDDGPTTVSLSYTLVVPDASCCPLSVLNLVNKGIAVLFVPGKDDLFDVEDSMKTLGIALQDKDALFYIPDVPPLASVTLSKSERETKQASTMMDFIASHSPVVTSEKSDRDCSILSKGDVYAENEGQLYEMLDREEKIHDASEPVQDN